MFSFNTFNNNNKKVAYLSRYWIVDSDNLWYLNYMAQVFLVHGRPDITSKMIISHQLHNIVCHKWTMWLITAFKHDLDSCDLYWLSKLVTLSFHVACTQFVLLPGIDIVYYYFGCDIIPHYVKSIGNVTWSKKHVHLSCRNTCSLFLLTSILFNNKLIEIVTLCLIISSFTHKTGAYLHIYKYFLYLYCRL